jgi:hypothetical protein
MGKDGGRWSRQLSACGSWPQAGIEGPADKADRLFPFPRLLVARIPVKLVSLSGWNWSAKLVLIVRLALI